jgi:regulator of replication initiation timing
VNEKDAVESADTAAILLWEKEKKEKNEKKKKKTKKKSDWQFEGNLADGFSVCLLLYVNQHPDIILW